MKMIKVKDIINKFNCEIIYGNENEFLENFSKDTRDMNKNDVYIGIKGDNFDGNLFYTDAFEKGAKVAIVEKNSIDLNNISKYKNKTLLVCDDSVKLLQDLASYKRSLINVPVIAVTGSVGKTSTKDMIYSVLNEKFNVLKTEGNLNNHLGLPLTLLKYKDEDIVVVEMGMNNLGEISLLSNIAKPDIAVITNIGTAHIGNLGSRENILKAKLEILDGMNNGVLIINNDNDLLHKNLEKINNKINTITIGIDNNSKYMATNIEEEVFESNFSIENNNINIKVGGKVFIYNSLISYSIGKYLNMKEKDIVKGLEKFKVAENRMEKIKINNFTIINDTYNASYDSIINAIDLIDMSNYNRKILLLGDILELGEFSNDIHSKIGKYILNKNIDYVILIGKEVLNIKNVINNKIDNKHFNNESECYDFLDNFLKEGDIILIKGSHGMNLINIVNYLKISKSE